MDNKRPTGRQIAAARTLAGMSQPDLAGKANISVPTLKRMEASDGEAVGMANNVAAIRAALESAGVIFVEENGEGPGVRLRKGVSGAKAASIPVEDLNAENDE
jgi:transcriptional regulator with XRE-family HTH domain